jgi:nitroimidazol reductase NimA-like FMN-containing flavoprotein (pyridoxamine 5'-phosphate oxidase superfamily)
MTQATRPATDHPVRVLDERECWSYLQQAQVGRIAVTLGREPEIFPVNYLVDHGCVVIRTAPGTKLLELLINNRVAFEIDGHDGDLAWSVVLKGFAEEVAPPADPHQLRHLPTPWADGRKDAVVEITPVSVTGRSLQRRSQA